MPSDIEELKRELDIVDVISDYIPLERVGINFRANCPFHPDKTPSFYVSPSRGIFKCFGCGVGGDAIKFVSLYEGLSYLEAAKKLAKRYGIKLKVKEEPDGKVYQLMEKVAEFYHSKLRESKEALDYLKGRGIEGSTARRFMLGFAPPSKELFEFLQKEGGLETYERTGNIIRVDGERFRDLLRNRLVFPIRDHRGRVVGFGGRILGGEGPKYVNSPESEIFRKRELLFGIYEGQSYLRELRSALLVEGYFDVVSLHQEGFRNAVAPLGTSFGKEHAKLLSKFVSSVYLLFDGDAAGRKAMRLAIPHLLLEGIEVRPVFLPEGTDPHDFLRREGKASLKALIESSSELFEHLLKKVKEGEDVEETVKDFTYFASFMKDEIRSFVLLSELSKLTKIPMEVLSSKVQRSKEIVEEEENQDKLSFTERLFLKGLLEFRPYVNLDQLNLSYKARHIAERILSGEYHELPEEVDGLKEVSAEEFEAALERLKIDIPREEIEKADLRESLREMIKRHKGGIRASVKRWWRKGP